MAALGSRTLDPRQLVSDGGAPGNDNRRACTLRTGLCRGGRGKLSPAAREPHSIHAVAPCSRMSQRDTPSSQVADPCSCVLSHGEKLETGREQTGGEAVSQD